MVIYNSHKLRENNDEPLLQVPDARWLEDEIPFTGLGELLTIVDKEQRVRRVSSGEPLTIVQVTIWKEAEASLAWPERPVRFVSYEVYGSDLGGIVTKSEDCEDIDDVLATLGLPV